MYLFTFIALNEQDDPTQCRTKKPTTLGSVS